MQSNASIIRDFLCELGFLVDVEHLGHGVLLVTPHHFKIDTDHDLTDIIIRLGRDVRVVPVPDGYLIRDLGANPGREYIVPRRIAEDEDDGPEF